MPLLKPSVNLDALRLGRDALYARDIPEIRHTRLRELQYTWDNAFRESVTLKANDLFHCAELHFGGEGVLPPDAIPAHAFFDVYFSDSTEPRSVLVCVPDTVKLEREADAPVINRWLAARGFITRNNGQEMTSA